MKKEKMKWSDYEFSVVTDNEGYKAFMYKFYLDKKLTGVKILSNCSHKKAEEKINSFLLSDKAERFINGVSTLEAP